MEVDAFIAWAAASAGRKASSSALPKLSSVSAMGSRSMETQTTNEKVVDENENRIISKSGVGWRRIFWVRAAYVGRGRHSSIAYQGIATCNTRGSLRRAFSGRSGILTRTHTRCCAVSDAFLHLLPHQLAPQTGVVVHSRHHPGNTSARSVMILACPCDPPLPPPTDSLSIAPRRLGR